MEQGGCGRMLVRMNKLLPIVAVLLAALALTTLSSASAAPSQSSHHPKKQVFTITTKVLDEAQVDVGKPGPTLGDSNVITEDAYRNGKRVGTSDLTCTIMRLQLAPKFFFAGQCLNTTDLPGGQITAQGTVTSDQIEKVPFQQVITGGTGIYKGVGGVLTVDDRGDGPAHLTFELVR
jgi:hypothetical protein